MLEHIHIRDFAIVDEADLELAEGMTVLTGETGAGKSILVDALGLVLGDRADSAAVRHGCKRAEITASFSLTALPEIKTWLKDHDLDSAGDCVLRRIINADGGSRAYVNGQPVPLQSMRHLGEQLVDIHGQQAHQSLVRAAMQREILDMHGNHARLCAQVADAFSDWQKAQNRWQEVSSAREERLARRDLLRYQVNELEALDLGAGEIEKLDREHLMLANSGMLADGIQQSLHTLADDDRSAAQRQLSRVAATLGDLAEIDHQLGDSAKLLAEAEILITETIDNLQRYAASMDNDPARLQWVESRLAAIQDLARKHHVEHAELRTRFEQLKIELEQLEHIDEEIESLQEQLEQSRLLYAETAKKLSKKRQKTARQLSDDASEIMHQLGMPGGKFEIRVRNAPEEEFSIHGQDKIEFQVSANPGQPAKSIRKVASGGELSRISLAIQVVAANATRIPALVFDEVDAGIGGGIAEIVGKRLRSLGASRQVLCVTHLPQVASQAHHHFRVSKLSDGKITKTRLHAIKEEEQVEELARMLGGVEITDKTLAHAREMIAQAEAG